MKTDEFLPEMGTSVLIESSRVHWYSLYLRSPKFGDTLGLSVRKKEERE